MHQVEDTHSPSGNRFVQFSLRTLLLVSTACAGAMGLWASHVRPYYVELEAIRLIQRCGGEVQWEPMAPRWVGWALGDEHMRRVVSVDVNADLERSDELALYAALRQFHCLKWLRLRSADLTPQHLDDLAALPSLQALTLEVCAISGPLTPLTACRQLTALSIIGMEDELVAPEALESLVTLTQLKSLRLNSHDFSERELQRLRFPPALYSLDLGHGTLGSTWLPELGYLVELERLDLHNNNLKCLPPLTGLTRLRALRLNGNPLGDPDGKLYQIAPGLQELDLSHTQITDEGLPSLGSFKLLEMLNLNGTAVTDVGLSSLHAMGRLNHIELESTFVTAAGVATLVQARSGKLDFRFSTPKPPAATGVVGGGGNFF